MCVFCGRRVTGKQQYADGACRKRAFDRRIVTVQAIKKGTK